MDSENYKILLADDEGIVTDSLQFIINKNFGDMCQCAVAKNGRQAIEMAESFRPDIIFLDIHMPNINGLRAMEEIRSQNQNVKIIMLTAYDNVEYTKEALRLSATDYLTKPINRSVIIDCISSLMETINKERQKRKEDLLAKEKMAAMIPVIENGFVISLIVQADYEDNTRHYRKLLDLKENYAMIVVLEWSSKDSAELDSQIGSEMRVYNYFDKMSELIKVYFKCYVSGAMGNKIICVIPCAKKEQDYDERVNFTTKARTMVRALNQLVGTNFKVGCGSARKWTDMFDSYQESLNALRHGKRSITHIDDLIVQDTQTKQRQMIEQELLKAVSKGIEYEVRREVSLFTSWELKNPSGTFEEQRVQAMSLVVLARRMIQEQGSVLLNSDNSIKDIMNAQNAENLYQIFSNSMVELTKSVVIEKEVTGGIITQSKEYIQQNFYKDLTLEDVAKKACVSPYYFSKLFKEEVGTNFIDYLTSIRIDTAKRLLADSQMSIKQVCIESGYANPNYFSRIFKKSVGITPTEFRDGLQ